MSMGLSQKKSIHRVVAARLSVLLVLVGVGVYAHQPQTQGNHSRPEQRDVSGWAQGKILRRCSHLLIGGYRNTDRLK